MTTLVSLATRDCVVMGCDSLATSPNSVMSIRNILKNFFDPQTGEAKITPQIKTVGDIFKDIEEVPYNQLPSVTKIFNLHPNLPVGVLFAGIAAIGNKSIKNLIDEFNLSIKNSYLKKYTLEDLSTKFLEYLKLEYEKAFGKILVKPEMEVIMSGYSSDSLEPEIFKLVLGDKIEKEHSVERGKHKVVFGGQSDTIERLVYGLDFSNYLNYLEKTRNVLLDYNKILEKEFKKQKVKINLPPIDDDFMRKLDVHSHWAKGITTNIAQYSDQAAIDFVDFLVDLMIKSQQFSNRLPTVGGNIHIAIITKSSGFQWISKEEYQYHGQGIPKHKR